MRISLIVLLAAAMAGCASAPSPAQLAAADDAACRGYGHRPGTEAYAKCRENKDMLRTANAMAWQRQQSAITQLRPLPKLRPY